MNSHQLMQVLLWCLLCPGLYHVLSTMEYVVKMESLPCELQTKPQRNKVCMFHSKCLSCWLSTKERTIFAFVGPMILIMMVSQVVNVCRWFILVVCLRSMQCFWYWPSWHCSVLERRNQMQWIKRKPPSMLCECQHKLASSTSQNAPLLYYRALLKATMILLPLLGLTWLFGLLTLNSNTTVFAWLFTIFNSLQVPLHPYQVIYFPKRDTLSKCVLTHWYGMAGKTFRS